MGLTQPYYLLNKNRPICVHLRFFCDSLAVGNCLSSPAISYRLEMRAVQRLHTIFQVVKNLRTKILKQTALTRVTSERIKLENPSCSGFEVDLNKNTSVVCRIGLKKITQNLKKRAKAQCRSNGLRIILTNAKKKCTSSHVHNIWKN